VRAVTAGASCPRVTLDGATELMQERARPVADYDVLVCSLTLAPSVRTASLEGLPLALPRPNPRRILIVGDTGCRISVYEGKAELQACNDPVQWPLVQVMRTAADWRPDLVIHVGDYNYRESPCPADFAGCQGSPSGYNWPTLAADFFGPAAPLLASAPWVFLRGNHENCDRNGSGWFRFFDPSALMACQNYTEPYAIPLGDLQLLVFDSSFTGDVFTANAAITEEYRTQLRRLLALAGPNAWLLSHSPWWAFGEAGGKPFQDTITLQEAREGFPAGIKLVISGHVHLFQSLDFSPRRPGQLIVGNSGTALDTPPNQPLAGMQIEGQAVTQATVDAGFGLFTMEAGAGGWLGQLRRPDGGVLRECQIAGRAIDCGK
jgi:hypothetical protein